MTNEKVMQLEAELAEMKSFANGLIILAKRMMPLCPDKARKVMEFAITEGEKAKGKYQKQLEAENAELKKLCKALWDRQLIHAVWDDDLKQRMIKAEVIPK